MASRNSFDTETTTIDDSRDEAPINQPTQRATQQPTANDQDVITHKPEVSYPVHPPPAYTQEAERVVPLERMQEEPELVDCPFCHKRTKTRVEKVDSASTM